MPDHKDDDSAILRLFGSAAPVKRSRLQFADCFVSNASDFASIGLTEVKAENTINRQTSQANPRQIERVTAGVQFGCTEFIAAQCELTPDLQLLALGMKLLQMDYLGGHGSRGSGRVGFSDFSFQHFQDETSDQTLMDIFKEAENYELFPNSSAI